MSNQRIRIIMNEVKLVTSTLQGYLTTPVDNGTLISVLNRLSILQAQLTSERKWKIEPDFTLVVQMARDLINYINEPLIIDPYYNLLKFKLQTSSTADVKILYLNTIIQILKKPTIANINS